MTGPDETPPAPDGRAQRVDPTPLLALALVFSVLTLVGVVLLAFALMGRGGVLLGVLGGLQTFICGAVIGALVRRWRALR